MATINWRRVWAVCKVHGWTWADLARRMGFSEAHLCEIRHGKRRVSMGCADLLCHALQLSYDQVLIHPTVSRIPSAREVLAMTELDDGRPYPLGTRDTLTSYQRYQREIRLAGVLEEKT